jgi:hypothetical protein
MWAAVKRIQNNDNADGEEEEYVVNVFDEKHDAAIWLAEQYEYFEDDTDADVPKMSQVLVKFLMETEDNNNNAVFQWEWERRGNFRTYRIVSCLNHFHDHTKNSNRQGFKFFSKAKTLWTFDDTFDNIIPKQ